MKKGVIYNLAISLLCSPLLYIFVRNGGENVYRLLLLPLPLLVTKFRYFGIGILFSTFVTVILTLIIPERQMPYRVLPFEPWQERIIISFELGLIQSAFFAIKWGITSKLSNCKT